jgi:hypothetical protein
MTKIRNPHEHSCMVINFQQSINGTRNRIRGEDISDNETIEHKKSELQLA